MNFKKLFATVAISAIMLTGCSFKKDTIIKINNESITMANYNEAFDKAVGNSMFAKMGIDIKNEKNAFLALMLKDKVVNELIIKTLVDQEVAKRNIQVTKEDTDNALKDVIDKVGSKEKFGEILKQNGITPEQFKSDLSEDIKMKKLVGMLAKIKISDSDAKKFYRENISKFKYPNKVRASHILISANLQEMKIAMASDPKSKNLSQKEREEKVNAEMAVKYAEAKKILAEVKKNPESFAKIAKENSNDTASAKQGGDLGFFGRKDMVEPFATVAFTQKPNTISGIVQTPFGYHIILVKDRMKAGQEPFVKVKDRIVAYLENQAQVKVLEDLIESLKKQANIEYVNQEFNPANIQEALKKASKENATAQEEMNPASQSATPAPVTPAK